MRLGQFHPEAEAELDQAADWYERQRPGLGLQFLAAVRHGLDQIVSHPLTWPTCTRRSRQYRLKRFPYAIVYQVTGEQVILLAIAHAKRRPGYWRKREMR